MPTDPKSPVRERDRTQRRILDIAAEQLCKKGYASTSLRDISGAANMKAGSLYYHFASKDELVELVLSQGIKLVEDKVREAIARSHADNAVETIKNAMIAHIEALHESGDYAAANIRCFAHVPIDIRRRLRTVRMGYDDVWRNLISRAHENGEIRKDIDLDALRYSLIGIMNWTLEWKRPKGQSPQEQAEAFYTIVFDGVTASRN